MTFPESSPMSISPLSRTAPDDLTTPDVLPGGIALASLPVAIAEPQRPNLGFLGVFGSTFITIFLAELGDKTQFATLLLAAQSHNPLVVFMGAAAALVTTSLIGVLIGRWLCQQLSPQTLERATAVTLLAIAGWLIVDVVQM